MQLSRIFLQNLARVKKDDALLLYENQRYSNAYYLYGYAIEIALKACVALQFSEKAIPDKKLVNDVYTHKISSLVALAGLTQLLVSDRKMPEINSYWAIVEQWSEEARYDAIDVVTATAMHNAVQDNENGAFQWITKHW